MIAVVVVVVFVVVIVSLLVSDSALEEGPRVEAPESVDLGLVGLKGLATTECLRVGREEEKEAPTTRGERKGRGVELAEDKDTAARGKTVPLIVRLFASVSFGVKG